MADERSATPGVIAVIIVAGLVAVAAVNFMVTGIRIGMISATHWVGLAILVAMLTVFELCLGLLAGWIIWGVKR